MSVINTNITAMIGQQNLGKSQSALQTSMERLSSGLRINSAADDAAGQAIANRMTAQTTGLAQAQRNANDGISVAQTAEGALNQVNDNLQRIRELTVQAQNDTNSPEDLNSIQDEITQRLGEIDRISEETNFNGVKVLAEDQEFSIQVGANDGEQITMNLKEINAETLGLDDFNVNTRLAEAPAAGDTIEVDGDTYSFVAAGSASTTSGDMEVESATEGTKTGTPIASGTNSLVIDDDGNAFVKNENGGEVNYYEAELSGTPADGTNAATLTYTVAADAKAVSGVTDDATKVATENPLAALDSALSDVDSLRSEMGAMQNRFDSAITNLSTTETNLSAARSRIEDADYAVEVSNMTRAQILQQAGTSVLAQANQVPQSVLSLLG
ncbi:MAG: FliC/FljB family flagellin [Pseudomonadota bacterium]|jgi:flagellin|uniref:FliC/FljB family flagellin n=1 Tax=Alloalcanivorax venustensis TaxID=172371 RepID=UPI002ECCFED6|nr:FliC/FljB family flagellin [Alcanivorax sp.]MED5601044.1 FliC/FljB family flagellin [Pseudomonadota bacterium]|tara:strand:- start:15584 stop:16735 length:1152 start_codon:yes stop_codon:yes gene_type:complete